jgi:hypothetical protein
MVEQIELLQRGLSSFAYSSFVPTERGEGSFLLDFFVTFFIKKKSLKCKIRYISVGRPSVEVRKNSKNNACTNQKKTWIKF